VSYCIRNVEAKDEAMFISEFIPTAPETSKKQETIEILEPRKQYNIGMMISLIG
jgi:hypothetical protein